VKRKVRHILGLSGGKDSAALAIYMRSRVSDIEYFFCDTGQELPEVYEYLNRLEAYLGRPIVRLTNEGRDFDHYLAIYNNYLPSPTARWCTRHLKLERLERYVGDDEVVSYVAIRADEDREGYLSKKPNITSVFPFREEGIVKADVFRMLESAGLGIPSYYEWRSRSGCYFCFFQRKIEWVELYERYPEYFKRAMEYEKFDPDTGQQYTWSEGESLADLSRPERIAQIKSEFATQQAREDQNDASSSLIDVFSDAGLI
jgi:3'-phosphoadenosine 5'-phosphosulfate sulfotransferase (PAPS reductase)/FAD synthetase